MRQRKKKKPGMLFVAGVVGAALLLALLFFSGAAGTLIPGSERGKYGTFSAAVFLENPRTHAGNKYRVEGTLDNILDSGDTGDGITRLVSLAMEGGKFIPVLVPAKSASFAIQRGQSVVVFCSINTSGLPVAELIEKK